MKQDIGFYLGVLDYTRFSLSQISNFFDFNSKQKASPIEAAIDNAIMSRERDTLELVDSAISLMILGLVVGCGIVYISKD